MNNTYNDSENFETQIPVIELKNEVYKRIKKMISIGELEPNKKILELDLAAKLGVSRTPIREALNKLEQSNLVVKIPRSGTYVKEFTIDEIEEIYKIRGLLEGNAARVASSKATEKDIEELKNLLKMMKKVLDKDDLKAYAKLNEKFHNKITSYSGKLTQELVAGFKGRIAKYRILTTARKENCDKGYLKHLEIFEAIKNRQPDLAEKSAIEHSNNNLKAIMKIMSENKS